MTELMILFSAPAMLCVYLMFFDFHDKNKIRFFGIITIIFSLLSLYSFIDYMKFTPPASWQFNKAFEEYISKYYVLSNNEKIQLEDNRIPDQAYIDFSKDFVDKIKNLDQIQKNEIKNQIQFQIERRLAGSKLSLDFFYNIIDKHIEKYESNKKWKFYIYLSIVVMYFSFLWYGHKEDEWELERHSRVIRNRENERTQKEYQRKRELELESQERENKIRAEIESEKHRIEILAMNYSIAHEKNNGRNPIDVSSQNLGYDIKSSSSAETRFIEVKGKSDIGDIEITANEWNKAKEFENNYYLYVVYNAGSNNPTLYKIQDPTSKLNGIYDSYNIKYRISSQEIKNHSS